MGTWTTTRPVPEDYNPLALRTVLSRWQRGEKPQLLLCDGFPLYGDDPLRDSHLLIDAFLREAGPNAYDAEVKKHGAGRAIVNSPLEQWPAHLRAILARRLFTWTWCVKQAEGVRPGEPAWQYDSDPRQAGLGPLTKALLKRRKQLDLPDEAILEWVDAIAADGRPADDLSSHFTIYALRDVLQRRAGQPGGLTPLLSDAVRALRGWAAGAYRIGTHDFRQFLLDLDAMLDETPAALKQILDRGEPWSDAALAVMKSSPGGKSPWEPLLEHCADSESSKPTGKWLKEAKRRIDALGEAEFTRCAGEWLALAAQPRTVALRDEQVAARWKTQFDTYSDKNELVLKGLAWSCAAAGKPALAGPLGALAEWCYKKIPNLGPRAPKVGNGCLIALIALPGQEPRAELSRLKAKVKQPTARKMIEKAIGASAAAAGMTTDDLEELAVGAYGLTEVGRGRFAVGGYTVETRVTGSTKVELSFTDPKGKSRASVPADLKSSHAADVEAVQQSAKDLAKMLPALRDRLERMPINRRELPMSAWRTRYLDHPVVGTLARRLIWDFVAADSKPAIVGMWLDGKLVGVDGNALPKLDEEKTIVRLWHPVNCPPGEVLGWRQFLQRHEVTQPFKQAHREVYLLTDAERATRTYSNRFAAHVLRQHQFAALCTQRGWKYRLMGSWDGGGDTTPTLRLPRWNLRAEYWLDGGAGGEGGTGVVQYVFTDQVRFYEGDAERPMPVERVPPLAFSEVMRDVDLFVGVTSVGNDPNWQPEGNRVGNYWQHYTFGELSASAETRRDVLTHLVPRLKIAPRCSVTDKFLVVRGDLRTYKIHLGSGNILMEPNDQYLCIVPDHRPKARPEAKVLLPFEGDQTLSVILSKAMLLADDTTITDPTITRQISPKPAGAR